MVDRGMEGRLDILLSELKLPSVKSAYRKIATEVSKAGGDYIAYLLALAEEEIEERRGRRVKRRLKDARFRQMKLLSELDPQALPKTSSMASITSLAQGDYIEQRSNVLILGNSGTGKTLVSTGLAVAACNQGHRVRFFTATELTSELEEAQEQHQLHRYLRRLTTYGLVVIDELGYLPISTRAAELLFQALSERHERGSVIVNSNLPFDPWVDVFKTERLAVAVLDRLTHRAHILEMNGESYRLRSAKGRRRSNSDEA